MYAAIQEVQSKPDSGAHILCCYIQCVTVHAFRLGYFRGHVFFFPPRSTKQQLLHWNK